MAENSIIKLLRYYFLKLKSFLFSKDVLSFLLFLILSAGFWFANALDKERETDFNVPIRYVGLPKDIAIVNSPPENIYLKVRDQGVNLFTYSKKNITPVTIDLSRTFYEKGNITISPDQIRGLLARFLLPSTTVLDIKPDSLFLQYEKLSVKTVPVEFISHIELAQQYTFSDKIRLSPGKITVFGPKHILEKLKAVQTNKVVLTNLSDTTILNCKFRPIKNVSFAADETQVSIYVEMFTEKNMQLPVKVLNCPDNVIVKTFPAVVNVAFNVGMSHFNSIDTNDLSVCLDYNDIKNGGDVKQRLKIINRTNYISNIRVNPTDVEYVMEVKK